MIREVPLFMHEQVACTQFLKAFSGLRVLTIAPVRQNSENLIWAGRQDACPFRQPFVYMLLFGRQSKDKTSLQNRRPTHGESEAEIRFGKPPVRMHWSEEDSQASGAGDASMRRVPAPVASGASLRRLRQDLQNASLLESSAKRRHA